MAIKFKITKAAFDALSAEMKAEYIVGDTEGEYVLDVLGLPAAEDVGPIKRALAKEKETVKTLKGEKDTLQATIDAAPDVEKLKADHAKEVGKYKTFTEKTLLDGTAQTLAAKISTVPALMSKELKGRMEVDLSGDEPVVRFKGADGKVDPNMTAEKLSAEYVANKDFSTIIIGSKASGGGAPKPTIKPQGGGAPLVGEQDEAKPFNWATATPQEIAANITAKKTANAEAESAT
jgi:hypothetical protein